MVTNRSRIGQLLVLLVVTWLAHSSLCRDAFAKPSRREVRGPSELRLAREANLQLELQTPAVTEAPTPLVWTTNVGRVDTPTDQTLVYTPSSPHFPQVAIIAAYDADANAPLVHFVQLIGSPTIEVKSEPNVSVMVQIAKASFGPQRTNGAGIALVQVEVAPGITTATTVATDAHGNVTRDELPLEPPSYPRLVTLCASAESAIYVIEVNTDGKPATTPTFRLQSDTAQTESATLVEPGVFRVGLLPREVLTEPKRADVRASTDDFSSACSVELTPPPVALPYVLEGSVVPRDPAYAWMIGAHLGWLTNASRISGPWASLRGAYAVSQSHAGLRIEVEAGLSQSTASVLTTDNQELELDVRTIPMFASARYVLDWGFVHPMAAVNLGAAVSQARATGANVLTNESFTTPWLGGSLGGMWWRGHHELSAEVGYALAKHSTGSVLGNVAGLRITVGYQYAL